MIRKIAAVALLSGLILGLSACGYDGWVRYPCQQHENWENEECQKPQCKVTGTCTEDLIGDGIKK